MARKKTENKEMPATEPTLKPVRVELSEEAHWMLRKLAADENVSMAAFARESFETMLREEFKRRGLK